jgi:hypothetical protein
MTIKKIIKTTKNRLMAKWFVCRITSGRKSAKYGIRFSYPLYISIVALSIFLVNPYILSITALIALFGVILPMHPFDYIYNYAVTKLISTDRIPGRGSELQVNSSVALLFNLGVIATIMYEMQLNYEVMALIYIVSSIFFIAILLFTDDFSIHSIYSMMSRRDK